MAQAYRILSLSGGGVRGVLPATVLGALQRLDRGRPVAEEFDLIAGTSTGAILALALAHGVPAGDLASFYLEHASSIFRPRLGADLRAGPRFDQTVLRKLLEEILGETSTLGDLDRDVLITAANIDTYRGHVFTRDERDVRLVDVALASAAAPTYFPPVTPAGRDRSFVDGGVWANDPSFLAVEHAITRHGRRPDELRLLSLGTGRVTKGTTAAEAAALRPVGLGTLRYVSDLVTATQSWQADHLCERRLGPGASVRIDPELPDWIRLDDHRRANEVLPAIAEAEFDRMRPSVVALLDGPVVAPGGLEEDLRLVRSSLKRVTDQVYADFAETAVLRYTVGGTRDDDRVDAHITTTVQSQEVLHWRRITSFSDTPPPAYQVTAGWRAEVHQGQTLEAVLIERTDQVMRAVVYFDPPIQQAAPVDWSYGHRWPGFFDTLRHTGEDSVATNVTVPTPSLRLLVKFPHGVSGLAATSQVTVGGSTSGGPVPKVVPSGAAPYVEVDFGAAAPGERHELIFSVDPSSL